jgi:hypothetical protein
LPEPWLPKKSFWQCQRPSWSHYAIAAYALDPLQKDALFLKGTMM